MDAPARGKLLAYLALLLKWNQTYNLTAVRELDQMLSHHLMDSLAVLPHLPAGDHIVDVGSGGGLPGIPLAVACPGRRFVLLDSNRKKTAFLQQAVIELALENVVVVCERVESWNPVRMFDIVISRAFSDLAEFVRLAGRLCHRHGMLVAMKGVCPTVELGNVPDIFRVQAVIPLSVPGLHAERHLVLLQPA